MNIILEDIVLQSKAGMFRTAGLGRDGIFKALKKFVAKCDGANYPDSKLYAFADAAAALSEWDMDDFFDEARRRGMSREEAANREAAAWNRACQEERRQTAKKVA